MGQCLFVPESRFNQHRRVFPSDFTISQSKINSKTLSHVERFKKEEDFFLSNLRRFSFDDFFNSKFSSCNVSKVSTDFYICFTIFDRYQVFIPLFDKLEAFQRAGHVGSISNKIGVDSIVKTLVNCNIYIKDTIRGCEQFVGVENCIEFKNLDQYYTLKCLTKENGKPFVIVPYSLYDVDLQCNVAVENWESFPDCIESEDSLLTLCDDYQHKLGKKSESFDYDSTRKAVKQYSDLRLNIENHPQINTNKFRYNPQCLLDDIFEAIQSSAKQQLVINIIPNNDYENELKKQYQEEKNSYLYNNSNSNSI
jgi:hypothetical protein